MIPGPLWRLILGVVAFIVVLIGGAANGAEPNLALAIAAAAGFGTIYFSWKIVL